MNLIWEFCKSVLLGIVQGITEWLPISSTGHMLLLNEFLQMNVSEACWNIFKVVIQLGSILAVVVLYFHKLNPFSPRKTAVQKRDTLSLWGKVLIASVPTAVIGLLLDDIVDSYLSVPPVIAAALIVYGVLFLWMESRPHRIRVKDFGSMPYTTALLIGCFQTLAIIPGTSRSGSTILGATLCGCSRQIAAEFSFFMAIPAMAGASGLKLVKAAANGSLALFTGTEWLLLAVGFIVAFLVSLIVIRMLMQFIQKHDFKPFGWYRIVLALVVLVWFFLR